MSCVLLEPDTYPFTTRLPAPDSYCPQDYPLPMQTRRPHTKDRSTVREGPTATDPRRVRAVLGSCPREEKGLSCLDAASCYLGSATEQPTSTAYTRSQRNRSSSLCLDSFLCQPQSPEDVLLCLPLSSALFQYAQSKHSSHFSGAPRPLTEQCRQISNDMP